MALPLCDPSVLVPKPLLVDEQFLGVDEGQGPRMLLFGGLGSLGLLELGLLLLGLRCDGGDDDVSGDDNVQVFGRLLLQGLDGVLDREASKPPATDVDNLVSDLQPSVTEIY